MGGLTNEVRFVALRPSDLHMDCILRNERAVDTEALKIKNRRRDFPDRPVVKNPPCNAGDVGSIPGWGTKLPHAVEQLNLHVTTTEPACSGAQVPQLPSPHTVKILHAVTKIK